MDASRGDILCVIAQASIEGSRSKEPGAFVFMARRKVPPPSRSAVFGPSIPERGTPSSPPGMGVPLLTLKESTMFAVPVTRETRPVGVLLGGSGLARILAVRKPVVAALLKPYLSVSQQNGSVVEACASAA